MNIEDYQIFFFDLDGLLVDTEPFFYRAFLEACAEFSLDVSWDFSTYYRYATLGRELFSEQFLICYPDASENLQEIFKKRYEIYESSLENSIPPLMPGVVEFLEYLVSLGKKFGVVTNSPREAVIRLRKEHTIFKYFLFWVTRENYARPKPYGDSYSYAYKTFASKEDRVIGFEDSIKGLKALSSIPATMVAISPLFEISKSDYPEFASRELFVFSSFHNLLQHCVEQKKS
ncbi:HAD family phosphatase [Chlamydia sp. 17-3921]|uniref:HAD family hydrolase n=1 Tax=Chlamydia sp. 17-3921 TaxID=2675798 RepID=UPI00191A2071|nr:HAD family phosphatase [Chlamydia sp. 17-3921]